MIDVSTARRFSIAPMLHYTDRHCRYLFRLLTQRALLFTEMVTEGALLHGQPERHLAFNPSEHPVALQLGGSSPKALAHCAQLAENQGFDEVNLNVGCPSDRVQSGAFGLCLMRNPALVAACVSEMKAAVNIPVTVKMRLGVDDHDSEAALHELIAQLQAAGVDHVYLHARKGWLKGLSPKENREVPPLQYDRVYHVKQTFPTLGISLNGGVQTLEAAKMHLAKVDGVMMGRAAYQHPMHLLAVDSLFFGAPEKALSASMILEQMKPYIATARALGTPITQITRHLLHLLHGQPGARQWRRALTEAPIRIFDLMQKEEMRGKIERATGVYKGISEDCKRDFNEADRRKIS